MHNMDVACFTVNPWEQWKIVLPTPLLMEVLKLYHIILGHSVIQRLYDTVRARFHDDGLHKQCIATVRYCPNECQREKDNGRQYGNLLPRDAGYSPFETVAVNLIGPWKLKVGRVSLEFNALTCIDPVTDLTEAIRIKNKTSKHISEQFQKSWLSRYPRPVYCIHDRGVEFICEPFQTMLTYFGLKAKPTTAKNPTANAICERMHHTVGDILRAIKAKISGEDEAEQAVYNSLYTCMHALRCAVNHTMQTSPVALVFHRDILATEKCTTWMLPVSLSILGSNGRLYFQLHY